MASKHSRDQMLVKRVAERLAAQDDQPVWENLAETEQRAFLGRAIGLLDLVDEEMPTRLVLCAHCPRLVPHTGKKCGCCKWPVCARCGVSGQKKARR